MGRHSKPGWRLIDLTGKQFGLLVVVRRYEGTSNGNPLWLCRCACGNEAIVRGSYLRTAHTKSCGCIKGACNGLPTKERLEAQRLIDPVTDCWLWQGARSTAGYGQMGVNGEKESVHRLAYKVYRDIDPGDLYVLHHCDNPPCFNPEHLFLGTHADNLRDSASKGRSRNQKKTHCPQGHPLTGDNIRLSWYRGRPRRVCKSCRRIQGRLAWRKNHPSSKERTQ